MTLVEFLLARIAEEEAAAHAEMVRLHEEAKTWKSGDPQLSGWIVGVGAPDRILLECEAKRRIVQPWIYDDEGDEDDWCYGINCHAWEFGLLALGVAYEGHPDFPEKWV